MSGRQVRLSDEAEAIAERYATATGISLAAAVNALVAVADAYELDDDGDDEPRQTAAPGRARVSHSTRRIMTPVDRR